MKKILFLALIAVFAVSCSSVPQVAKDAFATANPTATDVKWEKDGDKYDVSYVIDGVRYDAEYDKSGNIIADHDNCAGHNHADKACADEKGCAKADCTCGCKAGTACTCAKADCAKSCDKADCTCGCKAGAACTCAKTDCAKSCQTADSTKCNGKTVHADGKTCEQKHTEGTCCKK